MTSITPEQKTLLDYMAKGPEYQAEIFKGLSQLEYFTPIKDHSYFNANNSPAPIESEKDKGFFTIPHWSALLYLEKVSKECKKAENRKYADALIEIIRNVTRPEGDKNKRADNYRTGQSFVRIMANLPSDVLKLEDIDLLSDWLDSRFDTSLVIIEIGKTLLPRLLADDEKDFKKVERIIKIILDTVKTESRYSLLTHSFQEVFTLNASHLGQKCGKSVSNLLKNKIESVVSEKDNTYCYMWRPAIEDHKQNIRIDEYRHILIASLRDVLLAYASSNDVSHLMQEYFKSDNFIIRRTILYVLDKVFDKYEYKNIAEQIIINNIQQLFIESNYHHEWYLFITHHYGQFSDNIRSELVDTVSKLSGNWRDDVDKNKLDTIIRRRWLNAIKASGRALTPELENKYFKGIDYKSEHPEFLSYVGPVTWIDESTFSASELLAQGSIDNIISFLNSYQGKNQFEEPATREAGQSLKEAVKTNQEFFESGLLEFKKLKWEYWYYLIQAFENILLDGKVINWDKVLEFCLAVVKDSILWISEEKNNRFHLEPEKSWIPAVIADLIKKGVQNNEWPISDILLKRIDEIIKIMLDKQESIAKGKDQDALTEAINTSKGHVLECFNSYILRRYRIYERLPEKGKKEKDSFWKEVEPLLNREIERTRHGNFEFSSLAGAYLPNLYYLNKDWVVANINHIFPSDEQHWHCAMNGYSYVDTVYSVIYSLLKDNGHLKKALDTDFSNDQTKRRIIENVAISYLRGQETITGRDSLFKYILDKWQANNIEEIISLLWVHRDAELSCEQKERIFDFWRHCFNRMRGRENENKTILSDINLLTIFLDLSTNEQKNWLFQSAPFVEERYHSSFFLEYLDKLADSNPKAVGEIFLALLNKVVPSFKDENIRSIVEKIYKAGLKNEIANPICDKYARSGFEFLTDIYKKYNDSKKI